MTSNNTRTEIDLGRLLAGLEQPLQLVGDTQSREHLQAYISAARPHVERAAFDVLSQAVNAFNDANPEQRASLEYGNGSLFIRFEAGQAGEPEPTFNDSDLEKVTLRLPRELKDLIDRAAGRHGISANNWYVRELSRTIARQLRHSFRDGGHGDREGMHGHGNREGTRGEPHEGRRRGFYRGRGGSLRGFVGGDEGDRG